jgi:2-oxoglutarate ferredoxin oxidoreductase subunit gamma
MNEPSLEKFRRLLKNGGLLIINSSLAKARDEKGICFPFTDIAVELGNIKVANMVALGCFLKNKKIVTPKTIKGIIEEMAPKDRLELIKVNQEALIRGMEL